MHPWVAVVAAAAAIAVLAPLSPAQSLGEIAARTNKKKKDDEKAGKPAKVYTETDLRGRPGESGAMSQMDGPGSMSTASPAPGAVPPAGEAPKTEEEERAEKLTDWRARLAHAESEVTRISAEVDRAQTALNDFSGPMYGGNRSAAVARLDEGKKQLALAQQFVLDIQEEGRRARFR
jgi:hypothetical protein